MSIAAGLTRKVRNRLDRAATLRWRRRAYVSAADPIVIGGCPRSGTTLLRRILDTHSAICCGPESSLLLPGRPNLAALSLGYGLDETRIREILGRSRAQAEFVDRFMGAYAASVGTRRWAEKTPMNIRHLDWTWRHFPNARFIHVIRDGRDTVCSMREHADRRLVDGQWVRVPQTRTTEQLIRRWDYDVRIGMSRRGEPRYHEVRYEDLVGDPEGTLGRLFEFIGEPFEPEVLQYRTDTERARRATDGETGPEPTGSIHRSSIGRWRAELAPDEQALFRQIGGRLLVELGYERDENW